MEEETKISLEEYKRKERKNKAFYVRVTQEQHDWIKKHKLSATKIFTKALQDIRYNLKE